MVSLAGARLTVSSRKSRRARPPPATAPLMAEPAASVRPRHRANHWAADAHSSESGDSEGVAGGAVLSC